jgi:hypothetical protein
MLSRRALALTTAALLLGFLPHALAHGDDNGAAMAMTAHEATAPAPQLPQDGLPKSYWSLPEYATLMYWHIALEVLAWVVILPVGKHVRLLPTKYC